MHPTPLPLTDPVVVAVNRAGLLTPAQREQLLRQTPFPIWAPVMWGVMLFMLTELMCVEILSKHLHGLATDEVGWFAAYNHPVAGAALKCLHAAPFDGWSVDLLAHRVGVSRTVLTDHFRHFLAQPPMQYLANWRMQLAAQQLKTSELPIKAIADRTGYETEAAFSRAFKRHFGLPPGDWRRRQAQR